MLIRLPKIVLVIALAVALSACSTAKNSTVDTFAANVLDDDVSMAAPALPMPAPNVHVGLGAGSTPVASAQSRIGGSRPATQTVGAVVGLGSFSQVASVAVSAGDAVKKGDVLVVFEDAALVDAEQAAAADLAAARARVRVLAGKRDDLAGTESDIASGRQDIDRAVSQLTSTRADLLSKLLAARQTLARVEALSRQPRPQLPPNLPPGATPPGGGTSGGAAPQLPDVRQLRAGIAQLEAGIAKVDAGLRQAEQGRRKLDSAEARVTDARAQLGDLIELSRLAADSSAVAVRVVSAQRELATLRSPADGRVVAAPRAGEILAPGATTVVVRPTHPARIRTWLTPEQAADVHTGDEVALSTDWLPSEQRLRALVTVVGAETGFPQTSYATSEIHMTRAVPIEATVDSNVQLPPGTPVDLSFKER